MKICIPLPNLTFTGNVVFELAKELARKGNEVMLVVPHAKGERKHEEKEGVGIERFQYMVPSGLQTLAYGSGMYENYSGSLFAKLQIPSFLAAFSAKIISKAKQADVIHAHWVPAALAAIPAKKLLGKPLVLTVHGNDVRKLPKKVVSYVLKNCDAVTTGHDDLFDALKGLGRKDAMLIRNMADFGRIESKKPVDYLRREFGLKEEKVVALVSRLVEWKDPLTFVRAIPYVLEKRKDVKFLIVGHGELGQAVKDEVERLGIEKNVIITGRREDSIEIMRISDVFCAVSNLQNVFSVAIIEAMSLGLPCVLTKAGDTEKFFTDGKDSSLAGVAEPKEVGEAICKVLDNPKYRKRISEGGKKLMKKLGFDRKTILKQNLEVYNRVVEAKEVKKESGGAGL